METLPGLGSTHLAEPSEGSCNDNASRELNASRVFIPISLGNHYYTNSRLRRLCREIVDPSGFSLVFLCDQLRHLSYQIRGEVDYEEISNKVAAQLTQMRVTLSHCGFTTSGRLRILSWEDIASDDRIGTIEQKLEDLIAADQKIATQAKLNCDYFLRKFCGSGPVQRRTAEIQMRYLINETALSIYMNECIGFDFEAYRRGSGFVDFLYKKNPEEIKIISGGSARRKLLALETIWQEYLC